MELSTTLTLEQYLQYYLYTQKKSLKMMRIFGIIIILIGLSDIISCFFEEIIMEDLIFDITFTIIIVAIGLFFVFGFKSLTTRIATKMYTSNNILSVNPVFTYQFNKNNYQVLTTSSLYIEDCTYSYEMISHIVITKNNIYIFNGSTSAHIITRTPENSDSINKLLDFFINEKHLHCISDEKNA